MEQQTTAAPPVLSSIGLDVLEALARDIGLEVAGAEFYFLRHGETAGNASRTFQPLDEPLNARGHEQARAAATRLAAARIDRIVASDLPRAWLTAGKVAAVCGRPVHPEAMIRERFFGDWIGTPSAGFDWRADPPGGETLAVFVERTLRGMTNILRQSDRPLIVAHGGNLHVLRSALGLPLDTAHVGNALPLHLRRSDGRWHMLPL